MILWSSARLEEALASGQFDSWTKVKYLMVPAMLGSLSTPFYIFRPVYGVRPPALNSLFSFMFAVLAVYLTCRRLKRCFLANNEIDGEAFFERIVILTIPIMLRIIAAAVPASIALLLVVGHLKNRVPMLLRSAPIMFSASGPIIVFATYVMLVNSIRRLGRLVKAE